MTGRVGSSSRVSSDERLEVLAGAVLVRGRLVGDAPHDHARVVLVAGDQFAEVLRVGGLRVRVGVLVGEGRERRRPGHPADDSHVESDGGGLVDHDDAVAVGELEHLLGVGVVGGAERVRADPVHELEVVDHECVVVPLAADRGVFVLAEPGEVERLAVDEELVPANLDRADTDRDRVAVDTCVPRRRASTVSSYRYAAPGRHSTTSGTLRVPDCSRRLGDDVSGRVGEAHPHLGRLRRRHPVVDPSGGRRRSRSPR